MMVDHVLNCTHYIILLYLAHDTDTFPARALCAFTSFHDHVDLEIRGDGTLERLPVMYFLGLPRFRGHKVRAQLLLMIGLLEGFRAEIAQCGCSRRRL